MLSEDFNDLAEYECMIQLLSKVGQVTDCAKMKYKESPITYGDVLANGRASEIVLTCVEDQKSQQSLDYIIQIDKNTVEDDDELESQIPFMRKLELKYDSFQVE